MRDVTLEELLEAGCHFGHQVTRQNPKARDFIFEARDNIHIIDLVKTKEGLEAAAAFVKVLAAKGSSLLVLGTKRQAQGIVVEEVKRGANGGLFSVTSRWIGGTFTNFEEVKKNFARLKDLEARLANEEERTKYTKKEVGLWERERAKLARFYGGIVDMQALPDAIVIIDTHVEDLAVREARKTGVTTVGIVDTNADPTSIDYPIPANDDAVGSIKLITSYIMDAWIEGRKQASESVSQPVESETKRTATPKPKTKPVKKEGVDGKRKPRTTKKTA